MEQRQNSRQGIVMMAVCAAMWSTAGILIKLIPWSAVQIAGARSLIASAVLYLCLKGRGYRFRFNGKVLLAGACLCATFFLFVQANKLTTAANAIILQSTSPVHIMLLETIFLKKKHARSDFIAVGVTMLGIVLFFFDQLSMKNLLGNLLGILAGIAIAGAFVTTSTLPDDEYSMSATLTGHLLTGVLGSFFLLASPVELTRVSVGSIILLGVFQLGIPYALYSMAIQRCSPLCCSLLGMLEPLLNPVWVFLMVGERPGKWALIGSVIVMTAIASWCVIQAKRKPQKLAEG